MRFRANHLALTVRSIGDTLAWFRRTFPIAASEAKRRSADGAGETLMLGLADYPLELVEASGGAQGFRQVNHLRQSIDVPPVNHEIEAQRNSRCANFRSDIKLTVMRTHAGDFVRQA